MSAIQAQIAADAVQQEYDRIAEIEDEQRRAYELGEFEDFSVFRDLLPFLPVNLKQYAYDLMGGDKPLSVYDLTDKEIETLREIITPLIPEDAKPGDEFDLPYEAYKGGGAAVMRSGMKRRAYRQWSDQVIEPYDKKFKDLTEEQQQEVWDAALLKYPTLPGGTQKAKKFGRMWKMFDPEFPIETLLGHARIRINEQRQPVIEDRFNYNEEETARETERQAMGDVVENPLYNIARTVGGVFGSDPGEGSQIEIVIPPELAEGGPLYAAEGEPLTLEVSGITDRVAELEEEEEEEEEGYDPQLTLMGKIILDMLPSPEKSWGENIFDIATLAVPPAKLLKLGKLADPLLDTGIMQMANKGKTYGGGFTKPGYTNIRGGGRKNTLKTRSPKEWNVYSDIARFSDGGSSPGKLTPQQVDQLRAIMPKLRAAASSQTRHGRSTMNNVVRMFDDNFK